MAKKTKPKTKPAAPSKSKKVAKSHAKVANKPKKEPKTAKTAEKSILKHKAKEELSKKKTAKLSTASVDKSSKKTTKQLKNNAVVAKSDEKSILKVDVKQQPKVSAKTKAKAKKTEKKEDDFDDVLLGDDFGESEIAEYEDDLKAVEDEDEDLNDEISDDDDMDEKEAEVYLTDSEGRRLCRVRDCDQVASVEGHCRYHYLLLWKKIQIRKNILEDNKLEKYIEDLTNRYPDKFLEMIRKDMKSEKDFMSVIQELEIDESAINDMDGSDDDVQSFADEIRGVTDAPIIDEDGDY